jgi:hypothetical protein
VSWILDVFILIAIGGFCWFSICAESWLGCWFCSGCILIGFASFIAVTDGFVTIVFVCVALVRPFYAIISFMGSNGSVTASFRAFSVPRQLCMRGLWVKA